MADYTTNLDSIQNAITHATPTICLACRTIIIEGFTNDVLCKVCHYHYIILSQSFDSRAEIMQAVKELAEN